MRYVTGSNPVQMLIAVGLGYALTKFVATGLSWLRSEQARTSSTVPYAMRSDESKPKDVTSEWTGSGC